MEKAFPSNWKIFWSFYLRILPRATVVRLHNAHLTLLIQTPGKTAPFNLNFLAHTTASVESLHCLPHCPHPHTGSKPTDQQVLKYHEFHEVFPGCPNLSQVAPDYILESPGIHQEPTKAQSPLSKIKARRFLLNGLGEEQVWRVLKFSRWYQWAGNGTNLCRIWSISSLKVLIMTLTNSI